MFDTNLPKISIIIPVYNVEKYLKECIDSAINQTLKDIEIICINDGSTDNSLYILQEYAAKDKRIKIIDKKNGGVAIARNIGIENATGEYIMFLDSDDTLVPNACEVAFETIRKNNTDICIFAFNTIKSDNSISLRNKPILNIDCTQDIQNLKNKFVYIWDKIYKAPFLKNNFIKFLETCKTAEDIAFCWTCYFYGANFSMINKPLYNYRLAIINSATSNYTGVKSDFYTLKLFMNQEIFKKQSLEMQLLVLDRFCGGYKYYLNKFKDKNIKKAITKDMQELCQYLESNYTIKDLKQISSYKNFKNRKIITFVQNIFSINNSSDQSHKIIKILGIKIKIKRK